jgi:hypothetical protein
LHIAHGVNVIIPIPMTNAHQHLNMYLDTYERLQLLLSARANYLLTSSEIQTLKTDFN